ncbi:hypothetical protein SeLEV6574_g02032 [Synchytrium endobioticum]|uniref:Uncharacterized protein n=1 Tax=Synchytrium endobioticum TaxID=286115 RepID=A0A507DC51_9FUNG|nr:hypothetical protein SeLEV6574_g02032 [Synchytrium endobioticum]
MQAKSSGTSVTSFSTKTKQYSKNPDAQFCGWCWKNKHKHNNHSFDKCTRRPKSCLACPAMSNHDTSQCYKIKKLREETAGNAASKPKPLKDAYRHTPCNAKGKAKTVMRHIRQ